MFHVCGGLSATLVLNTITTAKYSICSVMSITASLPNSHTRGEKRTDRWREDNVVRTSYLSSVVNNILMCLIKLNSWLVLTVFFNAILEEKPLMPCSLWHCTGCVETDWLAGRYIQLNAASREQEGKATGHTQVLAQIWRLISLWSKLIRKSRRILHLQSKIKQIAACVS